MSNILISWKSGLRVRGWMEISVEEVGMKKDFQQRCCISTTIQVVHTVVCDVMCDVTIGTGSIGDTLCGCACLISQITAELGQRGQNDIMAVGSGTVGEREAWSTLHRPQLTSPNTSPVFANLRLSLLFLNVMGSMAHGHCSFSACRSLLTCHRVRSIYSIRQS